MDKILLWIPMYNCENQIQRTIPKLKNKIEKYVNECIIVNNRSTDDGENVAINSVKNCDFSIPFKVLRNDENYGLGGSHKVAFQYAIDNGYDYVITFHGDDQGRIDDVLACIEDGSYKKYDCCLGGRFLEESELIGYSKFRTFGNIVYNILFSIASFEKLYDLGAGINMYSTKMLKDHYYIKFKDNLMFNYYSVLALGYYKQTHKFFPIQWSEDDQVSNVKMFSQATKTLQLLWNYIINKKKFFEAEHRDIVYDKYTFKVMYSNK